MKALIAQRPAEGKESASDSRPRVMRELDIDPVGCENQYEITAGMPLSDAYPIAFRILWCQRIGKNKRKLNSRRDLPKLVKALNRCRSGEASPLPVTIESLLRKFSPYLSNYEEAASELSS